MPEFVPFVLTNHAKERMKLRSISTAMIARTLSEPHSQQADENGSTKYIRFMKDSDTSRTSRELHVVAFFNPRQNKWIVKTVFVRGENDSLLLKLWNDIAGWFRRLFQ